MRYCTKCGNPLEGERFCTKCGTDNGREAEPAKMVRPNMQTSTLNNGIKKAKNTISIDRLAVKPSMICHWAAIILFFILALGFLRNTVDMGTQMTSSFYIERFGIVYIVIYFVLGMWAAVPAVRFLLECGSADKYSIIKCAAVIAVLTVIFYIADKVMLKLPDSMNIPDIVQNLKSTGFIYLIWYKKNLLWSVLTIASAISGIKLEEKEVK